jgi:hypothetical protein
MAFLSNFQSISRKGIGKPVAAFFNYEVKPTVNWVVLDVVFGRSYTYMV